MVYDLPGVAGGVDEVDFEDCLRDFMLEEFNVEGDDVCIEEIARTLLRVRKEFTSTAMGT